MRVPFLLRADHRTEHRRGRAELGTGAAGKDRAQPPPRLDRLFRMAAHRDARLLARRLRRFRSRPIEPSLRAGHPLSGRESKAYRRADALAARDGGGAGQARPDSHRGIRARTFGRLDACRSRAGARCLRRGIGDLGGMRPMRLYDVSALGAVVYDSQNDGMAAEVAVIVPLYNYVGTVLDTLESLVRQDLPEFSVFVVDDASTDHGGEQVIDFLEQHRARFATARVLRHHRNQGLSMARNSGIAWSSEPYLFMLDADNRLRPPALSRLLEALQCSGAAFAYSQLCWFGEEDGIGIADVWEPERLAINNYIDAMALIRRDALLAAGGYAVLADDHGLEDYDLWCRFAELGLDGVFVPELICEYRVHAASMVRTRSIPNILALNAELALRHPSIFYPRGAESVAATETRRATEGADSSGRPAQRQ